MATEELIMLRSQDEVDFKVPKKVALMSNTIKDLSEAIPNLADTPVPLPNVQSGTLKNVLQWAEYHLDHPDPPVKEEEKWKTDNISEWDKTFTSGLRMAQLFDLILVANYLDLQALLDLGCKVVANLIKGKSHEEIEKTFEIPKDAHHDKLVGDVLAPAAT
eukprot:TRINITY_DN10769_c0_g3_i2.p1 TRINITY_DN10769_c0_g3~~TRINITY_DN10769_c0_g3_i2.p1  ORF type:complete len:176 (-),score=28.06 TRINITY_DN10769_c0_g3_i2:59-541(-)